MTGPTIAAATDRTKSRNGSPLPAPTIGEVLGRMKNRPDVPQTLTPSAQSAVTTAGGRAFGDSAAVTAGTVSTATRLPKAQGPTIGAALQAPVAERGAPEPLRSRAATVGSALGSTVEVPRGTLASLQAAQPKTTERTIGQVYSAGNAFSDRPIPGGKQGAIGDLARGGLVRSIPGPSNSAFDKTNVAFSRSLSGPSGMDEGRRFLQYREGQRQDAINQRLEGERGYEVFQRQLGQQRIASLQGEAAANLKSIVSTQRDPGKTSAAQRASALMAGAQEIAASLPGAQDVAPRGIEPGEDQRLRRQQAGIAAGIGEQQTIAAGLDNAAIKRRSGLQQRIAELEPNSPEAAGLRANLAALEGRDPRVERETFDNPVDELDSEGRPVRVLYGSQGSRRVVDGSRPMPKAGGGVTVGPDGTLVYSGAGGPKLTEQQSKDLNYYTRGIAALKNMGDSEALADPVRKAGASVPFIGNALPGGDYQKAEQAGREFLASVLRKDTGAAITNKEMEYYGKTYLPQPFDSPETLKQKAVARQTALDSIYRGMGPAQMLVPENEPSTPEGDAGAAAAAEAQAIAEQMNAEGIARNRQRKRALLDEIGASLDARSGRRRNASSEEMGTSLDTPPDYSSLWE